MLFACWSVKGGAGVSVVAAAIAHRLAREHGEALLVDLGGDQPDIVGVPAHRCDGVADLVPLGSDPAEPAADRLRRAEVDLAEGLALLPRGVGALPDGHRAEHLLGVLAADVRPVVVDCGPPLGTCAGSADALATMAAASATRSLLVLRPCLASLRRALSAPIRPSGLVVVREPGRVLDAGDAREVLGVPVVAEVEVDPAVARTVDAGLLLARPPGPLQRALRHAA